MALSLWSPFRRIVQIAMNTIYGCAYYYGLFPETTQNSSGKLISTTSDAHIKAFYSIDNWIYIGSEMIVSGVSDVFMAEFRGCVLKWTVADLHMADAVIIDDTLYVLTVGAAFNTRNLSADGQMPLPIISDEGSSSFYAGSGCKVWGIWLGYIISGGEYTVSPSSINVNIDMQAQYIYGTGGASSISVADKDYKWAQGVPGFSADGSVNYYVVKLWRNIDSFVCSAQTHKFTMTFADWLYTYTGVTTTDSGAYGLAFSTYSGVAASGGTLGQLASSLELQYSTVSVLPGYAPMQPNRYYSVGQKVNYAAGEHAYLFRHSWECVTAGYSDGLMPTFADWFVYDYTVTPTAITPQSSVTSGGAVFSYVGVDSVSIPAVAADPLAAVVYNPSTTKTSAQMWAAVEPGIGTTLEAGITYEGHYEVHSLIDYDSTLYSSMAPDSFPVTIPAPSTLANGYLEPSSPYSTAEVIAFKTDRTVFHCIWPQNLVRFHVIAVYGEQVIDGVPTDVFWRYEIISEPRNYVYAAGLDTKSGVMNLVTPHNGSVLVGEHRGESITLECTATASAATGTSGASPYAVEITQYPETTADGWELGDTLRALYPSPIAGSVTTNYSNDYSQSWGVKIGTTTICGNLLVDDSDYLREDKTVNTTFSTSFSPPFYAASDAIVGGSTQDAETYANAAFGALVHYPSKSSILTRYSVSADSGYNDSYTVTHHLDYTVAGIASTIDYVAASATTDGMSGNNSLKAWSMAPINASGNIAIYSYIFYTDTWPSYPSGSQTAGAYVNEHFYSSLEGQLTSLYGVSLGSANNLPYASKDDASKSFLHLGVLY